MSTILPVTSGGSTASQAYAQILAEGAAKKATPAGSTTADATASASAAPSTAAAAVPAPAAPSSAASDSGASSDSSSSGSSSSSPSSSAAASESASASAAASTEATYTNSYGDTVSMSGVVLVAARGDGHKGETDPDLAAAKTAQDSPSSKPVPPPETKSENAPTIVGGVSASGSGSAGSALGDTLSGQQQLLQKAYSKA